MTHFVVQENIARIVPKKDQKNFFNTLSLEVLARVIAGEDSYVGGKKQSKAEWICNMCVSNQGLGRPSSKKPGSICFVISHMNPQQTTKISLDVV